VLYWVDRVCRRPTHPVKGVPPVASEPIPGYLDFMRAILSLSLLLAGCGRETASSPNTAPPPPPVDLFAADISTPPAGYKPNPLYKNPRYARVNPEALQRLAQSSANIRLNHLTQPPATAVFTAKHAQVEGEQTVVGNLHDTPGAMIQLTYKDQKLSGRIAIPGQPELNIRHIGQGTHVIFELATPSPAAAKGE